MWIEVSKTDHEKLAIKKTSNAETMSTIALVKKARARQAKRYATLNMSLNSDVVVRDFIDRLMLSREAEAILQKAARAHDLSGRGYHRVIKLARTIADIDGSEEIKTPHILEAFQYRKRG